MAKKVIILDGDGVGPEVINGAYRVLENMGIDLDIERPLCGESAVARGMPAFSPDVRELCLKADAVLFGASGGPSRDILSFLRWEMDNYINIRPIKYFKGARSPLKEPDGVDFVLLRENSEGLYPGREGDISLLIEGLSNYRDSRLGKSFSDFGDGKFAVLLATTKGTERFARFAVDFTLKRKAMGYPGRLTCVTKSNVLRETGGLFQQIMEKESERHPEIEFQHFHIDDMARRLLRYPREIDVLATSNLFGDILGDEAAELVGGLGLAPSACIGGQVPYFEPVHGSAPKYAGRGLINPTAAISSAALMLEHLEFIDEAAALTDAIERVYRHGSHLTQDQGGSASTSEFIDAVLRALD